MSRYEVTGTTRTGETFNVGAWDTKAGVRGGLRLFHLRVGGTMYYWVADTRTGNGYKVTADGAHLRYDESF